MDTRRKALLDSLIQAEWPRLRRFFRTKVAEADVMDLVQNTMLAFADSDPESLESARGYLWGIARKQVLKHYETHRRHTGTPFDSTQHGVNDVGPSLSSRLDMRNQLTLALASLPTDQQIAFELRHGEEMKLEEVAEAIGVSLATVKRYLAAAEETLRARLGSLDAAAKNYAEL